MSTHTKRVFGKLANKKADGGGGGQRLSWTNLRRGQEEHRSESDPSTGTENMAQLTHLRENLGGEGDGVGRYIPSTLKPPSTSLPPFPSALLRRRRR